MPASEDLEEVEKVFKEDSRQDFRLRAGSMGG
jgi:hypothetical protein